MSITWHIERRQVADLIDLPGNPRSLTKKGLADLRKSVDKFGVPEPPVIQPDGLIIGGHGRKQTFIARGDRDVDCMVPDRELTPEEVRELNIRLNRNIAGEWDWDKLANEFDVGELKEWGFEDKDFAGFTLPDPSPQKEPVLDSECLIEIRCTKDALASFAPVLDQWAKRPDVTVDIS